MPLKVPRLQRNRFGIYCLRVLWKDENGKRREGRTSLHTRDAPIARKLALEFSLSLASSLAMPSKPIDIRDYINPYEIDLSRGVMKSDGAEDHARMMEAMQQFKDANGQFMPLQDAMNLAAGRPTKRTPLGIKFIEATERYLTEKSLSNKPKTVIEKRRTYKHFVETFGDVDLNSIDAKVISAWKDGDMKRGLGANRVNKRLGQVNDFFNWALPNLGYVGKNPVEGLFIAGKAALVAKGEGREPFTDDEVAALFSAEYPKAMVKPDHYWIPLVLAFCGARREDIAGLLTANVGIVDGVLSFFIEQGKTPAARRRVPMHPMLQLLGFFDYVEHVRTLGETYLFPHLSDGANGRGKNAGLQWGKWSDKCNITSSRKVLQSFRHNVITQFHVLTADPAHIMQIVGHADEAKGVHYDVYTHGMGLKALQATMHKLSYRNDFMLAKAPDPTFSDFLRRWKLQQPRKAARQQMMTNRTLLKK